MSWINYQPRSGAALPPNAVVMAVRKAGERLETQLRFGEAAAQDLGLTVGDKVSVARGTHGDVGLLRITNPGPTRVRAVGKRGSVEVRFPAEFLGLDRTYKRQPCKSAKRGPKGEVFVQLPAFATKEMRKEVE